MHDLIIKSNLSVRATNILLKNFASIEEFLNFNSDSYGKLINCGRRTVRELNNFRQDLINGNYDKYKTQDNSLASQPLTEDLLKLPPSHDSLNLLPIFSSKKLDNFTVNDLHQGFKGATKLSDFVISERSLHVLKRLKITKIGELMILPSKTLLEEVNFGRKSLEEVQNIIELFVLDNNLNQASVREKNSKQEYSIDYSSYEKLIKSFTSHCLKTARNQEIVSYRLNFPEKMPTLEEIGSKFGITRERARQVLKKGDNLLQIKVNRKILSELFYKVTQIILDGGGVISIYDLATILGKEYGWSCLPNPPALAHFLEVGESKETFTISGDLVTVSCQCLNCEKPRNKFLTLDFEENHSYHLIVAADELAKNCKNNCLQKPVKIFYKAFIEKLIGDFGETFFIHDDIVFSQKKGLIRYGEHLTDIVPLILEKNGKPMHFSEIATAIRKDNLKYKKVADHNVHAAMLRCETIEIVKRGTYGLKTWGIGGYHSVSKAIEKLLDKHGLPMRRSKIIKSLSEEFSEKNVSGALHAWKNRFVSIGDGFYDLPIKWKHRDCSELISMLPKQELVDFAKYITNNNKYSYKLVLAFVFIRGMNNEGLYYKNILKERFYNFYLARQKEGIAVEDESAIVSRINNIPVDEIKNKACKEPLVSFINSGFFKDNGYNIYLSPILTKLMRDQSIQDLLLIILLKKIDEYFSKLTLSSQYLNTYDKDDLRTSECIFTDKKGSNIQEDESGELFISNDDDDIIILS
jgi:hypothetical protein